MLSKKLRYSIFWLFLLIFTPLFFLNHKPDLAKHHALTDQMDLAFYASFNDFSLDPEMLQETHAQPLQHVVFQNDALAYDFSHREGDLSSKSERVVEPFGLNLDRLNIEKIFEEHGEHSFRFDGHAVTYSNVHSGFENALLEYMKAKWISYSYGVPLLYQPFNHSDHLVMDIKELPYEQYANQFKEHYVLNTPEELQEERKTSTLFKIPYFSEYPLGSRDFSIRFQVDWEDPGFRQLLREQIVPKEILNSLNMPENAFTVAIHIPIAAQSENLGCAQASEFADPESFCVAEILKSSCNESICLNSDLESQDVKETSPLKFPPLSWYSDQLCCVSALCGDYPIHVHLFTDDLKPDILTEYLRKSVDNPRITFGYRDHSSSHNTDIVEDLFSMANFECLIRPMSNFSFAAEIIGDPKLVIYPTSYKKMSKGYTIDATHITYRRPLRLHKRIEGSTQ